MVAAPNFQPCGVVPVADQPPASWGCGQAFPGCITTCADRAPPPICQHLLHGLQAVPTLGLCLRPSLTLLAPQCRPLPWAVQINPAIEWGAGSTGALNPVVDRWSKKVYKSLLLHLLHKFCFWEKKVNSLISQMEADRGGLRHWDVQPTSAAATSMEFGHGFWTEQAGWR